MMERTRSSLRSDPRVIDVDVRSRSNSDVSGGGKWQQRVDQKRKRIIALKEYRQQIQNSREQRLTTTGVAISNSPHEHTIQAPQSHPGHLFDVLGHNSSGLDTEGDDSHDDMPVDRSQRQRTSSVQSSVSVYSMSASRTESGDTERYAAEKVRALRKENAILRQRAESAEVATSKLEAEMEALKNLVDSEKQHDEKTTADFDQLDGIQLQLQIAEISAERDKLRDYFAAFTELYGDKLARTFGDNDVDISRIIEEYQMQQEEVTECELLLTDALAEIEELRGQQSQHVATKQYLEDHLHEYESHHTSQSQEFLRLKESKGHLDRRHSELQNEIGNLKLDLEDAKTLLLQKHHQVQRLESEVRSLKKSNTDNGKLLTEMQDHHETSSEQLNDLLSSNSTIESENKSLREQLTNITSEQQQEIETLSTDLVLFKGLSETAHKNLEKFHELYANSQEEFDMQAESHDQQMLEHAAELKAIKTEHENSQSEILGSLAKLKSTLLLRDLKAEVTGLNLEEAVELIQKELDVANANAAHAQQLLDERNELLQRIMQHMQQEGKDINGVSVTDIEKVTQHHDYDDVNTNSDDGDGGVDQDGKPKRFGESSRLAADFDKEVEALAAENTELRTQCEDLKKQLRVLNAKLKDISSTPDVENETLVKSERRKSYKIPEYPIEIEQIEVMTKQHGLDDLLAELRLAEDREFDAVTLIETLLTKVKALTEESIAKDTEVNSLTEQVETLLKKLGSANEMLELERQKYLDTVASLNALMALGKREEDNRVMLERKCSSLKDALQVAEAKICALEMKIESTPNFPELMSQMRQLELSYATAKDRLKKMLEWTKIQALRTWVSDRHVASCPACDKRFGFLQRKHHCRICGNVFCKMCTNYRIHTPGHKRAARSCASCHDYIMSMAIEHPDDDTDNSVSINVDVNRGNDDSDDLKPLGFEFTVEEDEQFGGMTCTVECVHSGGIVNVADDEEPPLLFPGDVILEINGHSLDNKTKNDIDLLMEEKILRLFVERERVSEVERASTPEQSVDANFVEQMLITQRQRTESLRLKSPTPSSPSGAPSRSSLSGLRFSGYDSADSMSDGSPPKPQTTTNKRDVDNKNNNNTHTNTTGTKPPSSPLAKRTKPPLTTIARNTNDERPRGGAQIVAAAISVDCIGKRCKVAGYSGYGTVRFVGKHAEKDAVRVGVEFDEAVGKNDGSVNGHRYFGECKPDHGLLALPKRVAIIDMNETVIE
eukprot:m.218919 g.218919  ORF g.218919 m.218919 type:complete len:1237 (+) comp33280_c0_seq1:267-3977(+)